MPIYEYHCNACGHEFEVLQKINDHPKRKCEKCGRLKAKRKISQTSFILKGSGWYVTDYSGKNPSNGGGRSDESSDKESSSTDSSSSEKADSKSSSTDSSKNSKKTSSKSKATGS